MTTSLARNLRAPTSNLKFIILALNNVKSRDSNILHFQNKFSFINDDVIAIINWYQRKKEISDKMESGGILQVADTEIPAWDNKKLIKHSPV